MTKRKIIPEFPNYEITSDGQIWNPKYKKYMKPFENVEKRKLNTRYYLRIALMNKNKKRIKIMVHRLVAMAFVNNPHNKPFVNHKDGNKQNNKSENLEWMTNRENILHASRLGFIKKKLTDEQVRQIRNDFEGWSHQKIANVFQVSRRLIGMIKKGERRMYVENY